MLVGSWFQSPWRRSPSGLKATDGGAFGNPVQYPEQFARVDVPKPYVRVESRGGQHSVWPEGYFRHPAVPHLLVHHHRLFDRSARYQCLDVDHPRVAVLSSDRQVLSGRVESQVERLLALDVQGGHLVSGQHVVYLHHLEAHRVPAADRQVPVRREYPAGVEKGPQQGAISQVEQHLPGDRVDYPATVIDVLGGVGGALGDTPENEIRPSSTSIDPLLLNALGHAQGGVRGASLP